MADIRDNLKIILEGIIKIRPGQSLLIVTDPYDRDTSIAYAVAELAHSMGVQTMLTIMDPLTHIDGTPHIGHEPPPAVAAAMKAANVVLEINEKGTIGHTTAMEEAKEGGTKRHHILTEISEYYLRVPISLEALNTHKKRTEKLAEIMTQADVARITTSYGTDIRMSLKGRRALAIHPLSGSILPDYGEAAISPVEGTTEGVIVADASVRGWGYLLRKPIRFEVKKGKVQVETVSSDIAEQAERFKRLLLLDQNASNCAAELGLGTSRTVPKMLQGTYGSDYGSAGTFHIACGRNNDIGGNTLSTIHQDVLMTDGSVKLDDVYVIENGELKI